MKMIAMAIHEADGQDVTMQNEVAYALVTGGGKPGQGYPCILIINETDSSLQLRLIQSDRDGRTVSKLESGAGR